LFTELQRRSVFKVAAAYLVVAWLVIQVAATVAPQLQLPEWTPRFVTLIVMLGFPVALVLAWVFEVTPDGLRADPAPAGNKRMFTVAAVLVVLTLGWYYRGDLPVAGGGDQPRLAVLPLSNFSPDPENAFFADGLHDDLLTALSRMQGVEVVSRTTMQTFKDSKKKLSDIAQEVGATQVLEGSVRRDATRVRLTVQLIDARNDDHLWAETYDRPLAEALTLQNEVAQAVARAMKVALGDGKAADASLTAVPGAYDLYLKSRLVGDREDKLKLLDSTLLLDPGFTQARAERAAIACLVLWYDETRSAVLVPQSRADIDRARREQPDLPVVDVAEAFYRYYVDRDWTAALAMADRALAKDPNNVDAIGIRGFLLRRLGRRDEALAAGERRFELDPGSTTAAFSLLDLYSFYGRHREATRTIDSVLARLPADAPDRDDLEGYRVFTVYLRTGDRAQALRSLEAARGSMPEALYLERRFGLSDPSAERLAWLAARPDPWQPADDGALYPSALDVAIEADALGETAVRDRALDEAARLYATLSPKVMERPYTIVHHAAFLALRGDRAGAAAEAQRALDASTPDRDATATGQVGLRAAWALARAGETERALEVLEFALRQPGNPAAVVYHEAYLRKVFGDQPRYQAAMKSLEAQFETL
jgi:TolB-like protein/tetratricopeptide (TPR) repeat protein